MAVDKTEIIEKWMNINYPNLLNNPEEISDSCCLYRSDCGNHIYLTHIYEFFSDNDEYKDTFKYSIILTNDLEKFFFNTFGEEFREHLLIWLKFKINKKITKIN